MLQMRVELPESFELEDGVLSQAGKDWMTTYQVLLEKNGFTNLQVVSLKT